MTVTPHCPIEKTDGGSCGAPAAILDRRRNVLVCIRHAPRCNVCGGVLFEPMPDDRHKLCAHDRRADQSKQLPL